LTSEKPDLDRFPDPILLNISMFDCQVALLENAIARYQSTGEMPGLWGS
jgi:hypothetical protein